MTSGANAIPCDVVRNLATSEVGIVMGSTQDGRLLIARNTEHLGEPPAYRWERWNVEIIGKV